MSAHKGEKHHQRHLAPAQPGVVGCGEGPGRHQQDQSQPPCSSRPDTTSADFARSDRRRGYAVENFDYPQADKILAEQNVVLKRGDGHITLADCATGTGQLEVMARDQSKICFAVKGNSGWLTLELPSVYRIRGNDYATEVDMTVGTEETDVRHHQEHLDRGRGERGRAGPRADARGAEDRQVTLVQVRLPFAPQRTAPAPQISSPRNHVMRPTRPKRLSALTAAMLAIPIALGAAPTPAFAVTGGTPSTDTTYAYTAQITIGDHDRGCSGVLVARQWLLTAASCFVADPAASISVPAGKPALTTTATIGRSDLTGTAGAVREVVELVPRTDRDVVLARLNRPVTNVTPVALATTAPTAGEELKFAGFGRTKAEWAPLNLHTGALSVDASAATTATVTGKNGAAVCTGDTGGPVIRTVSGTPKLAAINSRSYQGGCFGIDATETRTGGIAARVDGLASWVAGSVDAYRPLVNVETKGCLAVPKASTDNGTLLIQWTCSNDTEQLWRLEPVTGGNGDRYAIRNSNSKRCVAMPDADTRQGIQAIQWTCSGDAEQIWIHDSIGRLRNLNSDLCLVVPKASTTPGTKIIQWACATSDDQKWTW